VKNIKNKENIKNFNILVILYKFIYSSQLLVRKANAPDRQTVIRYYGVVEKLALTSLSALKEVRDCKAEKRRDPGMGTQACANSNFMPGLRRAARTAGAEAPRPAPASLWRHPARCRPASMPQLCLTNVSSLQIPPRESERKPAAPVNLAREQLSGPVGVPHR
jgi:hypothetical protein